MEDRRNLCTGWVQVPSFFCAQNKRMWKHQGTSSFCPNLSISVCPAPTVWRIHQRLDMWLRGRALTLHLCGLGFDLKATHATWTIARPGSKTKVEGIESKCHKESSWEALFSCCLLMLGRNSSSTYFIFLNDQHSGIPISKSFTVINSCHKVKHTLWKLLALPQSCKVLIWEVHLCEQTLAAVSLYFISHLIWRCLRFLVTE